MRHELTQPSILNHLLYYFISLFEWLEVLKMLPSKIVYFLNFFDIWGYNTASSAFYCYPKFNDIILCVHISLAVILTTFKYYVWTAYLSSQELLAILSESLQYLAGLLTYWLIIWDSMAHHEAHMQFWRIIQQIDGRYCNQSQFNIRNYLIKFIEFFSAVIIIFVARFVTASWYQILWAYLILFLICNIRNFYYIFCLEVVHFQLKIIKNDLQIMRCLLSDFDQKRCDRFYSFELRRLKWLHGYFQCIHELLNCLNEIFGWSHVATIFYSFYLVVTGLIWTYISLAAMSPTRLIGNF